MKCRNLIISSVTHTVLRDKSEKCVAFYSVHYSIDYRAYKLRQMFPEMS